MLFFLLIFRLLTVRFSPVFNGSKLIGNAEDSSILGEVETPQDIVLYGSSGHFDMLGDDVTRKIFEHLINDFASIRLVSKKFRKSFDDVIFSICGNFVPGFAKSIWDDKLKYRLIYLTRVIFSDPKVNALICRIMPNQMTNTLELIEFLKSKNLEICLKLTDTLLKVKLVAWRDVYELVFFDSFQSILTAWSLGLTSIAREMSFYHRDVFQISIGSTHMGLLKPIEARKYSLSRFMILSVRDQFIKTTFKDGQHRLSPNRHPNQIINTIEPESYLETVVEALIDAQYWDLLHEVYEMKKEYFNPCVLMLFAATGKVEGLRALRGLAEGKSRDLVRLASSYGHLEFLQELDSMGLLEKDSLALIDQYNSAICFAVQNGHTECVEFLATRLGPRYLDSIDRKGYMPIHVAAESENPETLRTIIRLYPYYESRLSFRCKFNSPLCLALSAKLPENAKILIERFPELIDLQNQIGNMYTPIHASVVFGQIDILELLLKLSKPETITAKTDSGKTALHLAACLNRAAIPILLNTGLFSVMERDNSGKTPVAIFAEFYHFLSHRSNLIKTFNLKSEEELIQAL